MDQNRKHSRKARRIRSGVYLVAYILVLLTACFQPFNFLQRNLVSRDPDGGLRFSDPAMIYTQSAASGLEGLTDFTVLLHLSVENPSQSSWIMSYGLDFDKTNFLVGTYLNQLVVEVHRGNRKLRAALSGALERNKPAWIGVVLTKDVLTLYVDGLKRESVRGNLGPGGSWHASYPLIVGSRSDGKYPWNGVVYRMAVLDYPAPPSAMLRPDSLIRSSTPPADFDFRAGGSDAVENRGYAETGPLFIPDRFVPYERAVLMDIEELSMPLRIWSDILMNVLAFVPIGFFVAAVSWPRIRPVSILLLVLMFSFGLSLSIEVLQSFLPRRWSTFMDLLTNTTGGLLGVVLFFGMGSLRRLAPLRDRFMG
jgi:hypothetical protein